MVGHVPFNVNPSFIQNARESAATFLAPEHQELVKHIFDQQMGQPHAVAVAAQENFMEVARKIGDMFPGTLDFQHVDPVAMTPLAVAFAKREGPSVGV